MKHPKFTILRIYENNHDRPNLVREARAIYAVLPLPGHRWLLSRDGTQMVVFTGGPPNEEWTKNDTRRLKDNVNRLMAINVKGRPPLLRSDRHRGT